MSNSGRSCSTRASKTRSNRSFPYRDLRVEPRVGHDDVVRVCDPLDLFDGVLRSYFGLIIKV